jgi:hypothetical protein
MQMPAISMALRHRMMALAITTASVARMSQPTTLMLPPLKTMAAASLVKPTFWAARMQMPAISMALRHRMMALAITTASVAWTRMRRITTPTQSSMMVHVCRAQRTM